MNGKTYVYKWYKNGVFQGLLNDVFTDFALNTEINTAGSQIDIGLGKSFEDSDPSLTNDFLINDDEEYIATDNLEKIIIASTESINFPTLGDQIYVSEIGDVHTHTVQAGETIYTIAYKTKSDYLEIASLNGLSAPYTLTTGQELTLPRERMLFRGIVIKWKTNYQDENIILTLASSGVQLDNYIVQVTDYVIAASQTEYDSDYAVFPNGPKIPLGRTIAVAQSFSVGSDTELNEVTLYIKNTSGQSLQSSLAIYRDTPLDTGSLVGFVSRTIFESADFTAVKFTFASALSLVANTTYHFRIACTGIESSSETISFSVAYDSGAPYSDGQAYIQDDITSWSAQATDIAFILQGEPTGVGNTYNSQDPGDIFADLLDTANSLGVAAFENDNTDSVDLTNTTVTYAFKFNTYLEALKKTVELAPSNQWWWVDPANDVGYFKNIPTTVNHWFTKGVHVHDLDIEFSLDNVINTVYFSGGDTGGGENLLYTYMDDESVSAYGTWLDKPVDNRVTSEDTAAIISQAKVNQFKDPRYSTKVTIPSSVYDVASIQIGELVGFQNFNSLIDSLELQVMAINYKPDSVVLTLDILPPSLPKRIEDIKRNLEKQQTENNPL